MSQIKTLSQQMRSAIGDATVRGQSKRSYAMAHDGKTDDRVFGNDYNRSLCDTARAVGNFIRENYPQIRLVREIRPEMLQAYLEHQARKGDTAETIEKTVSHIRKIDKIVTARYGRTSWDPDRLHTPAGAVSAPVRDKVMDDRTYNALLGVMERSRGGAYKSIVLAHDGGLRVGETALVRSGQIKASGGRWGHGYIILEGKADGTKGGRWRTVDIPSEEAKYRLLALQRGVPAGQPIVQKRDGGAYDKRSILRAIDRALGTLGISDEWKHSKDHALRKSFAQRCYDLCRSEGMTRDEAKSYVLGHQIGHGDARGVKDPKTAQAYIANMW